ncbi:MAG: IS1595 family transposase [Chloroflexi bacterium]|nr:IS1595 family transposase [Chloroflexota bacterium]
MPLKSMDMMQLMERFHKEEECRQILEELRWPEGAVCPRCEGEKHAYDSVRGVYDCYSCGYQFSVLVGTIFHDTKLPLRKWFVAVMLMVEAKKGMSANQMKRVLGVSYKTAWYLCHRIRAAMAQVNRVSLSGTVEVDETYVGGKVRGKGHGFKGNKTIVAGAVQRGGDIVLQVVDDNGRRTLHGFIRDHTLPATERIITDEWAAYKGINDADTLHETVNHSVEEWVRGDVHTNTVESVWSLFKRSVVGSYHKLSAKHLDAYLDELEWRFNNRKNPFLFRDTLMKLLTRSNVSYQELTAP